MRGEHRLWHGGHAFMAAAMGCMFLPAQVAAMSAPLWFVGSAGGAAAALAYALLREGAGARIDLAWITLVVGLGATAYMWLMLAGIAAAPLTYALAAWLVCETLGWFTGVLCAERSDPPLRPAVPAPPRTQPAPTVRGVTTGAAPRPSLTRPQPLAAAPTAAARLVLGLLGLGMAYVLVAMQQMPMP